MFGKKRNAFAVFTGVSIAALGAAAPAMAQQGQVSDEIIVTAQKREQNIQDVPIAVTALSSTDLEKAGIADIRALQTLSSSFNLNSTQTESGGTTIRIRGVGTTGNNAGLESSVGVFIDGVYISRPSIALGELLDVQQVEILRGPQGTLFGRNTSAGALLVSTRAPQLDRFGAFGNMTFGQIADGDFGGVLSTQAGVNIPIVEDKLAVRFSAAGRVRDGLLTSTDSNIEQNTRDRYYLRGQALFAPTDNITLRVIADYQEGNDDCCDAVIIRETPLIPFYAAAGLPANGGVAASGQSALDNRRSNSKLFKDPGEQTGYSAQLDWDLGWSNMTYIGSHREAESRPNVQESDFVGLNVYSVGGSTAGPGPNLNEGTTEYNSHELRFAGETGRLQWMVGAYLGKENISTTGVLTLGPDFQANLNANLFGAFAGAGLGANVADRTTTFTGLLTPAFRANPVFMGNNAAADAAAAATAAQLAANPAATLAGGQTSTGAFAQDVFTQKGETTSFFTHNTLSLTDKLDLTVGLRYVDESKDGKFVQPAAVNLACDAVRANPLVPGLGDAGRLATAFLCFPFAARANAGAGTPQTFSKSFSDNELVYTGNVSYAFTDDIRGYASYTHGFKSGGFNLDPTAAVNGADPSFKSEKVDSIEVGMKADFFDGRLRANAAIFTSELEDFQVLEFTGVQFQTFNVPKAQADGAEIELAGKLTDHLDATLAVTYTDARYPTDCAQGLTGAAARVVGTLCGSDLTNAPPLVSIFGLNYERNVGASGRFFAAGSVRYEDDRRTSTQEYEVNSTGPLRTTKVANDIQEANTKTNLRFGYGAQDESWTVELWGTNIFDEQTKNVTFNVPLRGFTAATNARGVFIEEPAIYGLTIRANY